MKKLIVANWKMNPASLAEALRLARAEDFGGAVITPPFVFLESVRRTLKKAALGVQDVFWQPAGPYTGEVSARELRNSGVSYVIVGHSERRALGETDEMVSKKVKAVLGAGLKAILCVGEPWPTRRKGIAAAKNFVKNQLQKDLKKIVKNKNNLIIAYEPVWSIGTGRADKPRETVEMARFIKAIVKARVLYGGSVSSKNAASFLKQKEIDGALIGGASIRPAEFRKIIAIL